MKQSIESIELKTNIWSPVLLFMVLSVLVISLWWALDNRRDSDQRELLKIESDWRLSLINADLQSRLSSIQRIVNRWVVSGGTAKNEFYVDSEAYLNDLPGLQALEWVDSDFYVRWVVPLEGNEQALNLNLGFEESRRYTLLSARESRTPNMTGLLNLVQGGVGILVYFPIFIDDEFDGFILAVINPVIWVNHVLKNADNDIYTTIVSIDDQVFYIKNNLVDKKYSDWKSTSISKVMNHEFVLDVIPTEKFFTINASFLPEWIALAGLLSSLLIGITTYLYQRVLSTSKVAMQTHDALVKNETRLNAVLENAGSGIITIDDGGIVQTFNNAAIEMFGYSVDEVVGNNIKMLMPEPYHNEHDAYIENYTNTGVAKIIGTGREVRGLRKNGDTFPLDLTVSEMRVGNSILFTGILRDVTNRKNIEIALQKQIAEVTDLYDNAPCGYHAFDENGYYTRINNTELEWLGYSRDEILGKIKITDLMTPESEETFQWNFIYFKKEGHVNDIEFDMVRKDGSVFTVLMNATALYDEHDNYTESRATIVNITERKQAEAVIIEAKTSAELANRAKSEFLSSMSHELRTPLNSILGFSKLFEYDKNLSSSQRLNAKDIHSAGQHLLVLIDEVLDLAKIETGHVDLLSETINLTELINTCKSLIAPVASTNDVNLTFYPLGENACLISADYIRLKQVLLNLLSNAIKYNHSSGNVDIRCELVESKRIRINITDTGPGISVEMQKNLFQPFNRLGAEFGNIQGTGIGLVITRELVNMMGGEIGFDSVYGEGSTFWVEFERLSGAEYETEIDHINNKALTEAALSAEEEIETEATESSGFHDASILIAEDNLTNQRVLQLQLELLNYMADFADDGLQALGLWQMGNYDILLTDIHMPNMDGYQLAKLIRDAERSNGDVRHIPIIAVTANAMEDERQACLDAGIDGIISKPVAIDDLKKTLEEWLLKSG